MNKSRNPLEGAVNVHRGTLIQPPDGVFIGYRWVHPGEGHYMVMNAEFPATVIADLVIEAEDSLAGSERSREEVRVLCHDRDEAGVVRVSLDRLEVIGKGFVVHWDELVHTHHLHQPCSRK